VVVNRKRDRRVVVVEIIRERCAVHELICDGGHFIGNDAKRGLQFWGE